MSLPADKSLTGGHGRDAKDNKGINKVLSNLSRVKGILKRPEVPSKRQSTVQESRTTASGSAVMSTPVAVAPKKEPEYEGATKLPRMQVHEERARKLGAKYGLEIQPSEWHSSEGEVLRIEKSVRVRVHRECHRCHTQFGTGNDCPSCHHKRCKQCVRSPPRRTESEKQANREKQEDLARQHRDDAPIIPHYGFTEPFAVTRPSRTPGGQPLVNKRPRMRVRRYCHVCDQLLKSSKTRVCENCGHRRCGDCSRIPQSKDKYPYGYPGDEPGSSTPFSCHECSDTFPLDAEDGTDCANCSHKKCADCPRVKPRRIEPKLDPEILRHLASRLEGTNIS